MIVTVDQQVHGYLRGHQLLSGSIRLPQDDQDTLDRLSDITGPLHPGETFAPYVTTYSLPSRTHYVIARTWQDLAAPRAGCVLTRSLLVPMDVWTTSECITQALRMLSPIERTEKAKAVALDLSVEQYPPPVDDTRMPELSEALFLENRKPIVFFEAPEAEIITQRLLIALWPTLRRAFAICTFALSPRKLGVRDFDLVFAPRSARARFVDWQGRKIDSGPPVTSRHRWSAPMAARIFKAPDPRLMASDSSGILERDTVGDESALRLALLWDELREKAQTTPTAVLGMLDILNFQRLGRQEIPESMLPLVSQALRLANDRLASRDAWTFLAALAGKFRDRPPIDTVREIRSSACWLASKDPDAAFNFLAIDPAYREIRSSVILAGLADGLKSVEALYCAKRYLPRLAPELGLTLLALSRVFAKRVVEATKREPRDWTPIVLRLLEVHEENLVRRARRHLIPQFDDETLAPLLEPLLRDIGANELATIAVRIGRQSGFLPAFDLPLTAAAKDAVSLETLRNAVSQEFTGPAVDRFLLSTLRLDVPDIEWLSSGSLEQTRARHLLIQLLEDASDNTLRAVQRHSNARAQLIRLLIQDVERGAEQIARILLLGQPTLEQFLEIGFRILPLLQSEHKAALSEQLLERSLSEASPTDQRVVQLLSMVGPDIQGARLVRMVTSSTATPQRIAENLAMLDMSDAGVRDKVLMHIDQLTNRLVQMGNASLGKQGYRAWASMLEKAGHVVHDAQTKAAVQAFDYALSHERLPVSPVIIVSFPIVYGLLPTRKNDPEPSFVAAVLSMPLAFLGEFDRAKSARRNLVRAFMRSEWPPADLLVAATRAGIGQKVLRDVAQEYGGNSYVHKIRRDTNRLNGAERTRAIEALDAFAIAERRLG